MAAAVWAAEDVDRIGSAEELRIAAKRHDGTLRRWVPIWVVCVGDQVYVRTWYRRDTGWFAHLLDSRRAAVQVPGLRADVVVADVAAESEQLHADVDAAYHTKYGRYGTSGVGPMVTAEAAATTLRLSPEQ